MANGVRCGQDGRRNHQGVIRYVPSAEGGRRCHVRLDEELRCERTLFVNSPPP